MMAMMLMTFMASAEMMLMTSVILMSIDDFVEDFHDCRDDDEVDDVDDYNYFSAMMMLLTSVLMDMVKFLMMLILVAMITV